MMTGTETTVASARMWHWLFLIAACIAVVACNDTLPLTAANARRIGYCQTPTNRVLKMFGDPDEVGLIAGKTTWTYLGDGQKMIVMFSDDVAVDVALVSYGATIELKNRCK